MHPVTVYRQRSSVNDPCPKHHHHHHRDADDVALDMTQHPNIWTDGRREDFSSLGGFEVAGAGVHLPASVVAFDSLVWGTAEEYGDARLERCRAFLPVPGRMQTVQRAEFWGARTGHVI